MKKLLPLFFLAFLATGASAQCYSVSQINYAPDSFNVGTVVPITNDDFCTCMMDLPFPFCFFGSTYTRFMIGSNGNVGFDSTYACSYDPWPISAAIPNSSNLHLNCIMFPWEDLYLVGDTAARICYTTYGVTPNRRFVVSFYHVSLYNCLTSKFTGEVILYETSNNIEMHIQNKPLCPSWNGGYGIEGIQDATGTQAAVVPGRNYPTQWTAVNDAWRFSPNCCTMDVSEMNRANTSSVYPNPSSGELHFVSQDKSSHEFCISISDVTGREIYRDELSVNTDRRMKINATAGVYFLQLRGHNGQIIASQRIIIE